MAYIGETCSYLADGIHGRLMDMHKETFKSASFHFKNHNRLGETGISSTVLKSLFGDDTSRRIFTKWHHSCFRRS